MSELTKKQDIENKNLEILFKSNPTLLKRRSFIEDANYLSKLGIYIPNKNNFKNKGFIKLWTEDFIVEEILQNNQIVNLLKNQKIETEQPNSNKGNFTMTLIKNNIGTSEAVTDISKQLNIPESSIGYAGMKDHDALTSQKISISNINLEQIYKINSRNYYLTNIKAENTKIKIGQLKGNHFTILVRTNPKEIDPLTILDQIKEIKENGFYNFYYSQRFGTFGRDNSHTLGLLMLQKKYDEALKLFLTDPPKIGFEFTFEIYEKIKDHYGNWDYIEKLISPYPIIFERELAVVNHLIKNPNDTLGALGSKKDEIRWWMLAFASWLFNMKLSNYLLNKEKMPEKIDLITSTKENISFEYKKELESIGLEEFNFDHLSEFNIQKAILPVDTIKKANLHKIVSSPYGFIFKFSLDKGSYATTMLSHCLDLVVGTIPENYSLERVDTTKSLGDESVLDVIESFYK